MVPERGWFKQCRTRKSKTSCQTSNRKIFQHSNFPTLAGANMQEICLRRPARTNRGSGHTYILIRHKCITHWRRVPLVKSSVMKFMFMFFVSHQLSMKDMMFLCFSCFRTRISANRRSFSVGEALRSLTLTWFHATSSPSNSSNALYTVLKAPRPSTCSYCIQRIGMGQADWKRESPTSN